MSGHSLAGRQPEPWRCLPQVVSASKQHRQLAKGVFTLILSQTPTSLAVHLSRYNERPAVPLFTATQRWKKTRAPLWNHLKIGALHEGASRRAKSRSAGTAKQCSLLRKHPRNRTKSPPESAETTKNYRERATPIHERVKHGFQFHSDQHPGHTK